MTKLVEAAVQQQYFSDEGSNDQPTPPSKNKAKSNSTKAKPATTASDEAQSGDGDDLRITSSDDDGWCGGVKENPFDL